jgi:hypothetical protein
MTVRVAPTLSRSTKRPFATGVSSGHVSARLGAPLNFSLVYGRELNNRICRFITWSKDYKQDDNLSNLEVIKKTAIEG